MMINRMQTPPIHHSYNNLRNNLPAYQGYLTDPSLPVTNKRPLKPDPRDTNSPHIGSYRFPHHNFEKQELAEKSTYTTALVMDERFKYMTTTELRVEDYYLMRTCPRNSELYNIVFSNTLNPHLNQMLYDPQNTSLKQPDLNRPWPHQPTIMNNLQHHPNQQPLQQQQQPQFPSQFNQPQNPFPANQPVSVMTNSQSGQFQTPQDRLSLLNRNKNCNELNNTVQSIQKVSFDRAPPPNFYSQLPKAPTLPIGSIRKTIFDDFLQFFYNDLRNYHERGENIQAVIESHLDRIFHQEAAQKRVMQGVDFSSPTRKRSECAQIKTIIDLLWKEMQEKRARREDTPGFAKYASDVMIVLQEISTRRNDQLQAAPKISPERLRAITQQLQQKEAMLINRYHALQREPLSNPPISTIFQQSSLKNSLSTGLQPFSLRSHEEECIRNQVFLINSFNSRLKSLYEQERLQRELHLMDINKRKDDDFDEYFEFRRKKKEDQRQIVVIVKETIHNRSPKVKNPSSVISQNQSHSSWNYPHDRSPEVSQFKVSPSSHKNILSVSFTATILWVNKTDKQKEQLYKTISGSFKTACNEQQNIEQLLKKRISLGLGNALRQDAVFIFKRQEKRKKSIYIVIIIQQQKLNLPSSYSYKATFSSKDNTGLLLDALKISNQHGQVHWDCPINIQELDFTRGGFEIGNNTIQCEYECLNLPCTITFFTLPTAVTKMEERYFHSEIQERMRKNVRSLMNMQLLEIDWNRRRYTIAAKQFFTPDKEDQEKMDQDFYQKKKQLEDLCHRMGVMKLTMTQSPNT